MRLRELKRKDHLKVKKETVFSLSTWEAETEAFLLVPWQSGLHSETYLKNNTRKYKGQF